MWQQDTQQGQPYLHSYAKAVDADIHVGAQTGSVKGSWIGFERHLGRGIDAIRIAEGGEDGGDEGWGDEGWCAASKVNLRVGVCACVVSLPVHNAGAPIAVGGC